jgi:hypothetical protein
MLGSTLINSVSDLLGWGQIETVTDDPTPETRKVVRALNSVLHAMQNDKDWPELNVTATMTTVDIVEESDKAFISKGSATLWLDATSVTSFSSGDVGKYVQINGSFPYKITVRLDARRVTLERVWSDTSVALGDYKKFSMVYSLPTDYDRLLGGEITILNTGGKISEISPTELRQKVRDNGVSRLIDDPEFYAVYGVDSLGYTTIHFDKVFDEGRTLEYAYQKKHPDLQLGYHKVETTILYPERYTLYIIDQTVAKLARDVENSAQVQQQASDAYKEAMRVNSNPATGRERSVMTVDGIKHGSYRRR